MGLWPHESRARIRLWNIYTAMYGCAVIVSSNGYLTACFRLHSRLLHPPTLAFSREASFNWDISENESERLSPVLAMVIFYPTRFSACPVSLRAWNGIVILTKICLVNAVILSVCVDISYGWLLKWNQVLSSNGNQSLDLNWMPQCKASKQIL